MILAVDEGTRGSSARSLHNTVPLAASVTDPAKPPRSGLATTGPSAVATPAALGAGAVSGAGSTSGETMAGAGGAAMVSPPCRNSGVHGFRITAATTAAPASTT